MSAISFTKMHGLGNDYIYIDCTGHAPVNPDLLSKKLSDRHFGVGADGLVLILPSAVADFRMRMFNADGSEAQMCGNAVRCVARFLFERRLIETDEIALETGRGVLQLKLFLEQGDLRSYVRAVKVNLGAPILESEAIPVKSNTERVVSEPIDVAGESLLMTCVSMGNPHAVFFVEEITDHHVLELGPLIENHSIFPERTNVEFVKIIERDSVEMRVWERGSGETLACGTGAAAVVVAGRLNGYLDESVAVNLRGGVLDNQWSGDENPVYQTGPAEFVFDGVLIGYDEFAPV